MFKFTFKESDFLNSFYNALDDYVKFSYKFSMTYISNPILNECTENERLVLLTVNKSVFQNLYSFLKLNNSNFQYSAFACLEAAVNAMRLYHVLSVNQKYMHSYITEVNFSLEICERELIEKQAKYVANKEDFSLIEFSIGLHKLNTFELKNASISSQINNGNVFLGLSCGNDLSEELQSEVRKNMIGAYLSLKKHNAMFFNGEMDKNLEDLEDKIYGMFLEYIKKFS